MKYVIEIDCSNAAFDDDGGAEMARILMVLASQQPNINMGRREPIYLRDINGNKVGTARYLRDGDSLTIEAS